MPEHRPRRRAIPSTDDQAAVQAALTAAGSAGVQSVNGGYTLLGQAPGTSGLRDQGRLDYAGGVGASVRLITRRSQVHILRPLRPIAT
jgi:hypothetical protein